MKLDRVDNQILAALQRAGRLSNRELAEQVHLSESACLRRMRALEEAGVIDRYVALDYLLRVVVSDPADFERLHSQHLTRLPGVARVQSSFALRTVRKGNELPLRD
ncbi:MAG: Lrp/AsnC family transcriptional regulator [Proteobacteria bacterium]|nr:Lrp/AsnC family transcriptional regulator [Pseudomonadota bacterium]